LQNPFPLIWLPCKRAAKLTVFLVKWFNKKNDVEFGLLHPSTQGASMMHNISSAKSNWLQCNHAKIYPCPWYPGRKKIKFMLHDIIHLSLID
jgi:hypothetical protein